MITAPQVIGVASGARRYDVAMVLLTATVIAALSLVGFGAVDGVEDRLFDGPPSAPETSAAVAQVVLQQEAQGLTCRAEPMLAGRVVFQYTRADADARHVVVLDFDEAIAALRSRTGSIQRYCS